MHNPFIEEHVRREVPFADGDYRSARAIVESEYANAPDPVPCRCGGTAFYKATIGAMKCTSCGDLYFADGDPVDLEPSKPAGPLATERQVNYIRSLVQDRDPAREVDYSVLTKKAASDLIGELLAIKPQPRPVRDDIVVTSTVPDGTYTVVRSSGEYRTLRLRSADWATDLPAGSQVAEFLSGPDNGLDFTGFAFVVKGRMRVWKKYRDDSEVVQALQALLTADEQERSDMGFAYALKSERCYLCGHKLTVPASIHRGLGPVCAGK